MDTLGYVGRGFSTFNFVGGLFIGLFFIVIAVVLLFSALDGPSEPIDPTKPPVPVEMKVGFGLLALFLGVLIPYGAWVDRKLVRGNDKYASIKGGISIFNMLFRGGRK